MFQQKKKIVDGPYTPLTYTYAIKTFLKFVPVDNLYKANTNILRTLKEETPLNLTKILRKIQEMSLW